MSISIWDRERRDIREKAVEKENKVNKAEEIYDALPSLIADMITWPGQIILAGKGKHYARSYYEQIDARLSFTGMFTERDHMTADEIADLMQSFDLLPMGKPDSNFMGMIPLTWDVWGGLFKDNVIGDEQDMIHPCGTWLLTLEFHIERGHENKVSFFAKVGDRIVRVHADLSPSDPATIKVGISGNRYTRHIASATAFPYLAGPWEQQAWGTHDRKEARRFTVHSEYPDRVSQNLFWSQVLDHEKRRS